MAKKTVKRLPRISAFVHQGHFILRTQDGNHELLDADGEGLATFIGLPGHSFAMKAAKARFFAETPGEAERALQEVIAEAEAHEDEIASSET